MALDQLSVYNDHTLETPTLAGREKSKVFDSSDNGIYILVRI